MLSSVAIILFFAFFLQRVRKAILQSNSINDGLKNTLVWGLCSLELGCVSMEQGVLMKECGILVWAVSLVLVVTWQISTWEGLSPNVLGSIVEMSAGSLARVPAMLAGSLISYRLMSFLWKIELSSHHHEMSSILSSEVCKLGWSSRPLLVSIMAEYLGTLVLSTIPRLYIMHNQTLVNNDASMVVRGALTGLLVLILVLLGMDVSGAMFNPTLAAVLVGGCAGYSVSEHVLVYWVSPILAAFSGNYLCSWFENKNIEKNTSKKIK